MTADRLERQIRFIVEIDKLKSVFRQTLLTNKERYENDAEHSWHIAVMAVLLAEYAADPNVDVLRVVKMLLVHDIVEIDAGDMIVYDQAGRAAQVAREQAAAERIFNILPADQAGEIRDLWTEFEARTTPEALFAAALDRLQPLLHNYHTQGAAWKKHGITVDRVIARNQQMAQGAPKLWEYARAFILDAVAKGYLARPQDPPAL